MFITYVTDTTLDSEGLRIVSVVRFKGDVQTPAEVSPYGIDSNPIKDIAALFGETNVKGDTVCYGYFVKNKAAAPGELRTFSTDASGAQKFYTWLKADGTYEIGGTADNAVRYSKLATAFNELKGKVNSLITAYNGHTHPYTDDGSPAVTSPTTSTATSSSADITTAKINEIKTL